MNRRSHDSSEFHPQHLADALRPARWPSATPLTVRNDFRPVPDELRTVRAQRDELRPGMVPAVGSGSERARVPRSRRELNSTSDPVAVELPRQVSRSSEGDVSKASGRTLATSLTSDSLAPRAVIPRDDFRVAAHPARAARDGASSAAPAARAAASPTRFAEASEVANVRPVHRESSADPFRNIERTTTALPTTGEPLKSTGLARPQSTPAANRARSGQSPVTSPPGESAISGVTIEQHNTVEMHVDTSGLLDDIDSRIRELAARLTTHIDDQIARLQFHNALYGP